MRQHVRVDDHDAEQPDWFTGISVPIGQIGHDYAIELRLRMQRLQSAHETKNASAMKLAAEDLEKFLGGMSAVAGSVARAAIVHINRRPRP